MKLSLTPIFVIIQGITGFAALTNRIDIYTFVIITIVGMISFFLYFFLSIEVEVKEKHHNSSSPNSR